MVIVGMSEWEAHCAAQCMRGSSVSWLMVSRECPSMGVFLGSCCAPKRTSLWWFVQMRVALGSAESRVQFRSLVSCRWLAVVLQMVSRVVSGRYVSLSCSRAQAWMISVMKHSALCEEWTCGKDCLWCV